ncbi:MAG TPA: sigma-54 dependent transcriptional regulator [Gemmatimonadaceae bacterium]|nr:sigma-54 dependent transcriptional regulator [Gemmatimonadaceae bacterium]
MATVLVVDDERSIRSFLTMALGDDGHETAEAGDALSAIAIMRERAFDVLITDLRMPGVLGGIDLLRTAKSEQPELEVIVLTAHGTVDSAVEAMKLGAFDYLQKPLSSPAELRLLVSRALEHKRLASMRDAVARERESLPPLTWGDPVMRPVVRAIEKVAPTNATVLLLGESGTGKEVAARTIHRSSRRRDAPFVAVNCAAISEHLMESEIFGHERGAFTGATATRRGRLELADGGTLFLDEIGELKTELQAKLLRVLQERSFERVGGTRTMTADVRWIAATNRDLAAMVQAEKFRADLYHRLAVFPIELPPLRERKEDILPLADMLLARISADLGRPLLRLEREARQRLAAATWPGNVRELANALERAAILSDGEIVRAEDIGVAGTPAMTRDDPRTLAEIERDAIRRALDQTGGSRRAAADRLGMSVRTLYERLKRYDIS